MLVNFSADVLSVVRDICYICEIRNHTELSLVKTEQSMKAELNSQLGNLVDPIMTEGALGTIQTNMPFGTFRAPARHGDVSNNEVLSSGTKLGVDDFLNNF